MELDTKTSQEFEICSEKTRSFVGQIPSILIRYCILSFTILLLSILTIIYLLPYKQSYSGTAIIQNVTPTMKSMGYTTLLLLFDNQTPQDVIEQKIYIKTQEGIIIGHIKILSNIHDSIGYQKALCILPYKEIKRLEHQKHEFLIIKRYRNFIQKCFPQLWL